VQTKPAAQFTTRYITMKLNIAALVISLAALAAGSPVLAGRRSTLDDFIRSERRIALQGTINNIGGTGSLLVPGADPGIVVASPSRVNPDYFFTWTRDSALVLTMLVHEYINGDESIQPIIEDCQSTGSQLKKLCR
jgi:glucoamylase